MACSVVRALRLFSTASAPLRAQARARGTTLKAKATAMVAQQLKAQIRISGPITVAEYMKTVLRHPAAGYYAGAGASDPIGERGDFVTSPELGQMFGEIVGVWLINEWQKVGSPKPFQIVELGPGRGSLCSDIIKVFNHFKLMDGGSVHLVEISPALSDVQARRLCFESSATPDEEANGGCYHRGVTTLGVPVSWYRAVDAVPRGVFTLLVAHEFFDALPVHVLQQNDQGVWCELLVDFDESTDRFRFVLSPGATAVSKVFAPGNASGPGAETAQRRYEVCPEGLALVEQLTVRLEEDGGIALIADYGHTGDRMDTFRAFKNHKLHDPLEEPGSADLTADVDFKALKEVATKDNRCIAFGPVSQKDFLLRMGLEIRLKKLLEHASAEEAETLKKVFAIMTDDKEMGERFKFLSLFPQVLEEHLKKFPVVGFS